MGTATILQPSPQTGGPGRSLDRHLEPAAALVGTALVAGLLVLTTIYAGPLWRDETNSINVAQMPSLGEFWDNMRFESFPPLWVLLLRLWDCLGLANNDIGIRMLGLLIGLFFLGSLWLCARWMGAQAPLLSLTLLGSLPAVINILGADRAYGLAMCLLVLSFGMIWRVVASPSMSRIVLAALVSLLFLHCIYYDVVFLFAMLFGAALVVVRRRQWKTLAALVGIGTFAGGSMAIYLPLIRRNWLYGPMNQMPIDLCWLWAKLGEAIAAQSSAHGARPAGHELWLWIFLLLVGVAVAIAMQTRWYQHPGERVAPVTAVASRQVRADMALFSAVSVLCGTVGFIGFLLWLQFPTQPWYYAEMLTLCAISLDGLLGGILPAVWPWGLTRVGLFVVMLLSSAGPVWEEARTRRTNVDLIAASLEKGAREGDLIVVHGAWEGITFDRYYHGRAHWMTLPPIDSHKVHRNDLVWQKLNQRDPIAPVLKEIGITLQSGGSVWVVGHVTLVYPEQLPPPLPLPPILPTKWRLGPYLNYWAAQVMAQLLSCAAQGQPIKVPAPGPVNHYENLPLLRFSGYKPATAAGEPQ